MVPEHHIQSECSMTLKCDDNKYLEKDLSIVLKTDCGRLCVRKMCYLINSWQYPEYFSCASCDHNITANCIQNIHSLRLPCFPRPGSKSIWFRSESSNWTQVNHIPRKFRQEEFFNICSHL